MQRIIFGFLIYLLTTLPVLSAEENLDYKIVDGRFVTSEGDIPNGCFGQLMTELNGDNSVAAIYLNRAYLRGCINSNTPYPGGFGHGITYEIIDKIAEHSYQLRVCQEVKGSIGAFCDKVLVMFTNREYLIDGKIIKVLSLEKLGQAK